MMASSVSAHGHVPELDLSALHPVSVASVVDRFNETVPGLKTSTAFLTFLRANLALDPAMSSGNSPFLSPQAEPILPPSISGTAVPSVPASLGSSSRSSSPGAQSQIPSDLPHLTIDRLTRPSSKSSALRLIATSIAEDRAVATKALALHPLSLTLLLATFFVVHFFLPTKDLGTLLIVICGTLMGYLSLARLLTAGYESSMTNINPSYLLRSYPSGAGKGGEDVVLGAMWGSSLIGTLVLRLESSLPPSPTGTSLHRRHKSKGSISSLKARSGKGIIRAWTVESKYRGQGVGASLLNEAVRVTREHMGKDAEVGFAREHANSTRVLPEWFDRGLRRRETRAGLALRGVLKDWESRGWRR